MDVDLIKLQSKKVLKIDEGSSSIVKKTSIMNKDKGKGIKIFDEEKKRL